MGTLEASSRIALSADAFVQERTETSVEILELALSRVPELQAVVRDRGTPYLNEEVTKLLANHGVLPINAHPHVPIDKPALEHWWRTLKEWLRHALAQFDDPVALAAAPRPPPATTTRRNTQRSPRTRPVLTASRPGLLGRPRSSWRPLHHLIREVLGQLREPHVRRTDVSSQHS